MLHSSKAYAKNIKTMVSGDPDPIDPNGDPDPIDPDGDPNPIDP